MSKQQQENLLNCAKGSWQREIISDFIKYQTITNPIKFLKGAAKSYSGKYQISFDNLISRIEKLGFSITVQLGPHGGMWGSTYTLS